MARVVLENLTKHFKGARGEVIRAVNEASLAVEDGEFLVLVGPSGCGKSTTLRLIAGLEEVTSGTIWMDEQVINAVSPKDRDIAMVFQNFALYPHMTVRENMAFGLKLRKMARAEVEERVNQAAELLGLKDCLTRKPAELSGGQKQRVAVGRAMVRQPKVFLFDEPLSNLDAPLRVQMRREIAALHARLGTTMIYVTHDQVEAMTLGARIAVMKEGVFQQVAAPMELYHRPANLFVAGFIGSPAMNFFRGTVEKEGNEPAFIADCGLRIADLGNEVQKRLADFVGKKVMMGLRAENIMPTDHDFRYEAEKTTTSPQPSPPKAEREPDAMGGSSLMDRSTCAISTEEIKNRITGENAEKGAIVQGTVELIEPLGAETFVYAKVAGNSFVGRVASGQGIKVGQVVSLRFDMGRAHFFDAATERVIG